MRGREEFGREFSSLVSANSAYSAGVRIMAANAIARLLNSAVWKADDVLIGNLSALLLSSFDELPHAHGVYVARAFRALTPLTPSANLEPTLQPLLEQAVKKERISSFSAMDISEVCHSVDKIKRGITNETHLTHRLDFLLQKLFQELLDRRDYMRVQLDKRHKRDDQWLSIQAISNILYATRGYGGDASLRGEVAELLLNLCAYHAEVDALKSCQPIHVVSIIESCITASHLKHPSELRAFKKLLDELLRKRRFIDDSTHIHRMLQSLHERWASCTPAARSFIVRLTQEFSE